jgi:hypothetical protein
LKVLSVDAVQRTGIERPAVVLGIVQCECGGYAAERRKIV